ncbi:MAG TPA: flagellar biosynthesis protein FlhF [Steroidobacteraceae bacterium]|nr:flagellar biosynthesis protein FlhF [Steroidobacteraceae bacterium]
MRIIRYVAPNTRLALRGIRERLGDHAVILSSRRIAEGIEVTAGAEIAGAAVEPPATVAPEPAAAPAASAAAAPEAGAAALPDSLPPQPATEAIGQELKSLREMLETQVAQLAWSDLTRRMPVHAAILEELAAIGIGRDIAGRVSAQLPAGIDRTSARRFVLTALAQYLPVAAERSLEDGGRLAFIGATGVGKTTSLAKIAVRWSLRHSARELALIAADSARIGAHDELRALGELLGAAVYVPQRFGDLPQLLDELGRFRLVLIDTPGCSVRDPRFAQRLAVLANCASHLQSVLVLAASTQAAALEETVRRFAPANPASVLLTKLDEAASLGGALSVLIRARLPLLYVSEGQRVPEDLRPARALDLLSRAVALARDNGASADEDLLRRRFGKVAHGGT